MGYPLRGSIPRRWQTGREVRTRRTPRRKTSISPTTLYDVDDADLRQLHQFAFAAAVRPGSTVLGYRRPFLFNLLPQEVQRIFYRLKYFSAGQQNGFAVGRRKESVRVRPT